MRVGWPPRERPNSILSASSSSPISRVVAEHVRAVDRDHVIYDWQHYLPLVERKPGGVAQRRPVCGPPRSRCSGCARRSSGTPAATRSWPACSWPCPPHGLDAVLVAIELVLESGRPSAEHVLNVIARLTDGPSPPTVVIALTVTTTPVADPHRYDTLREEETHG